jgi:paraquat-inducible protein A
VSEEASTAGRDGVTAVPAVGRLVACPDCDLLLHKRELARKQTARCPRCGTVLYRAARDVIDRTLAFSLASLVLFIVTNCFPFMDFAVAGRDRVNFMVTGILQLWREGYWELAAVVAFTSILAPLFMISCLLYLTLPLRFGWHPPGMKTVLKLSEHLAPWSMMEVYLLGVIVSVIKLSAMADLSFGPAAYAFGALIVVLTAAQSVFEPEVVWDRMEIAS